jgi:diacylglycerol O-acyltransferase / wax synthase
MAVGGTRAERMDPADVVWLHMDRPGNLMVVNTVLWFDGPVDQASVLQLFQERVVSRVPPVPAACRGPGAHAGSWAAPEWIDDAGFALAGHVSRMRLPAPGDQQGPGDPLLIASGRSPVPDGPRGSWQRS